MVLKHRNLLVILAVVFILSYVTLILFIATGQEIAKSKPEKPSSLPEGQELISNAKKFANFSGLIISAPIEYKGVLFPRGSPNENRTNMTIEFQVEDEQNGLNVSIKSDALLDKNELSSFNINSSLSGTFFDRFTNFTNWYFSIAYDYVDVNDSEGNLTQQKVFKDYNKIPNLNLFKNANLRKAVFLDPTQSACGTISSAGYYTQTQEITATATCITISSSNVDYDCQGFRINYSTSGVGNGILVDGGATRNNVTIRNCRIFESSATGGDAISLNPVNGFPIYVYNNTISLRDTASMGISMNSILFVNITNNTITNVAGNSQKGIYLATAINASVENNTIILTGTNGVGIEIAGANTSVVNANNINVTLQGLAFSTGGSIDSIGNTASNNVIRKSASALYFAARTVRDRNNTFVNNTMPFQDQITRDLEVDDAGGVKANLTTFVDSEIQKFVIDVLGIKLTIRETDFGEVAFYDHVNGTSTTINNFTTSPNAVISITNNSIFVNASNFGTNQNFSRRANFTFFNNVIAEPASILRDGVACNLTSTAAKCFNYTSLTATTVIINSTTATGNYTIFTPPPPDDINISVCRDLNQTNKIYHLNTSVGTTGTTCMNFTASNVTLACDAGKNISYSQSFTQGFGVTSAIDVTDITLRDCLIQNNNTMTVTLSHAVSFTGNTNGKIMRNVLIPATGSYGVVLNSVVNMSIFNNSISQNDAGPYNNNVGIFLARSKNNTIKNNTIVVGTGTTSDNQGMNIFLNSTFNLIENNRINVTGFMTPNSNGILLNASEMSGIFPHNNNITNNTFGTIQNDDITFVGFSLFGFFNDTFFVDQIVRSWTFNTMVGPDGVNLLTIENRSAGNIRFLTNVSGSSTNLYPGKINISNNSVALDPDVQGTGGSLNVSANITLYGIGDRGFSSPAIFRNGVACNTTTQPSCYNFTSLTSDNVIFNVSAWSNYSIGDMGGAAQNLSASALLSVSVSNLAGRLEGLARNILHTFSISNIVNRLVALFRNIIQSFSIQNLTDRLVLLARNIIQSFSIQTLTDRLILFARNNIQSVSFQDATTRTGIFYRNNSLSVSTSTTAGTSIVQTFTANVLESFSFSSIVSRSILYPRQILLSLSLNDLVSRLLLLLKNPLQAITTSDLTSRLAVMNRNNSQTITFSDSDSRQLLAQTNIIQVFSLSNLADRQSLLGRNIQQSLTTDTIVSRFFILSRSVSDTISIQTIQTRSILFLRNVIDSFSINNIVSKLQLLSRNIIQALTITAVQNQLEEPPVITIDHPQNKTYFGFYQINISLNVSANKVINQWNYSLDGNSNITFTPNTTFTILAGGHTMKVYALDTAGRLGNSSVNFAFTEGEDNFQQYLYGFFFFIFFVMFFIGEWKENWVFKYLAGAFITFIGVYTFANGIPNTTLTFLQSGDKEAWISWFSFGLIGLGIAYILKTIYSNVWGFQAEDDAETYYEEEKGEGEEKESEEGEENG